jgi:predicted glycogen debranching enzyme
VPHTLSAPLVRYDRDALLEGDAVLELEWLETDGLGGYASSTPLLCPTRRYHGLLVVRPPETARRYVLLARVEETLGTATDSACFSSVRYADGRRTAEPSAVESFELVPWPRTTYRIGDAEVTREVLRVRGEPTALVRWRVTGLDEHATLELRPRLPYRAADDLTIENDALDTGFEELDRGFTCRPYDGLPATSITLSVDATVDADPTWDRGIAFAADEARGYSGQEDEFGPAVLRIDLGDEPVVLAATTGAPIDDPAALWAAESERRLAAAAAAGEGARARVTLAADDFLYRTPNGRLGILAGFPWFVEWGRDTFIALPGLTLARGRVDDCAEVLSGAVQLLQDGLLPNVYGTDPEDSHYGSVDAALWFARAVRMYELCGGDVERVRDEYLPALLEIAEHYEGGTGLGIAADDTGLLHVGSPDLNPTWMDAQTADGPVTPRHGYPVEIEALWYSLLAHLERLQRDRGDHLAERRWGGLRRRVKRAFLERFWLEDERYLADRWLDGERDRAVRPNMVLAAALEFSPLTRHKRAGVVERARFELLTRRGLRTLSPRDSEYVPRYDGGPDERDRAYHQGTVWPWLLGFYTEAYLRAYGLVHGGREVRDHLRRKWDAFAGELDAAGLDHVSEVYDGDPPHRPGGTIAQAWNTAELLRSLDMLERGRP